MGFNLCVLVLLEFDLKKGEKLFGLHFRFFLKSVFQLGNSRLGFPSLGRSVLQSSEFNKIPTIVQKNLVVTHVRELEFPFYREKIYL
ncbi:hypothetical protein, partial [Leptospira interrogans]